MTISFACPSCQAQLKAPEAYQGKKANCKKCGQRFVVPTLHPASLEATVLAEPGPTANVPKEQPQAQPVISASPAPAPAPARVAQAQPPAASSPTSIPNPPAQARTPAKATKANVSTASPAAQVLTPQQIDTAFVGSIKKVPLSIGYKLSLLVVSFCMILLPLIYIGLIVLVAYGAIQYAQQGTTIFDDGPGRSGGSGKGKVVMYVGPLVIAAITVIFMIKPFFARMPKAAKPRSLKREEEPVLFEFVARICKTVGAPIPKRIDIDTEVNATASFRSGWLSLLQPNDLVLTIGMPLVKGLTARELGGVLAHEFGHFSQGMGMRLSYVIRSISMWFARVVYQRDRADEWLAGAASAIPIQIGIVLYAAMLVVWLTRRILWCLMMIGHGVSGMLLRQMEYDADSYEIQVAGSKSFASTFGKLQRLGLSYHRSLSEAESFYTDGKLVDDFPRLTKLNHDALTAEELQKLEEHLQQQKAGWFDTHPSDKDRIAAGDRMNAQGILNLDAPAEALFVNPTQLSRAVTRDFYVNLFEDKFSDAMLASVEELTSFKADAKEAEEALKRMFGEAFTNPRAMYLGVPNDQQLSQAQALELLHQARQQMDHALPQYIELSKKFDEADTRWLDAQRALALLACDMKLKQADWTTITVGSKESLESTVHQAQSELAQLHNQLLAFEQAFARRVDAALQWLFAVERQPEQYPADYQALLPLLGKARGVLATLHALDPVQRVYLDIRNDFLVVYSVIAKAEGNLNAKQGAQLNNYGNRLMAAIPKLVENFENIPYPFEHQQGAMSIAKFLAPQGARPQNVGHAMEMTSGLMGNVHNIYFRSIGTLSAIIEKVEATATEEVLDAVVMD